VSAYVDSHRDRFGVEPICETLDVSASAYYRRGTGARSARMVEDERLLGVIGRTHAENYFAYGYRRMWEALTRAGEHAPRCQVRRLMAANGIVGAKRRGKPWRTTRPDRAAVRSPELVKRDFTAGGPNALWVADFTYLRCWEWVVYFSFVIDVFSRMIVGWQLAANMRSTLVLDARCGWRSGCVSTAPTCSSLPTAMPARSTPQRTTPSSLTTPRCGRRSARSAMRMTVRMSEAIGAA
jgi:putative transposase